MAGVKGQISCTWAAPFNDLEFTIYTAKIKFNCRQGYRVVVWVELQGLVKDKAFIKLFKCLRSYSVGRN